MATPDTLPDSVAGLRALVLTAWAERDAERAEKGRLVEEREAARRSCCGGNAGSGALQETVIPDHRVRVELAAIDPHRAAEAAADFEGGLDEVLRARRGGTGSK